MALTAGRPAPFYRGPTRLTASVDLPPGLPDEAPARSGHLQAAGLKLPPADGYSPDFR